MWIILFYLFSSLTNGGSVSGAPAATVPAPPVPAVNAPEPEKPAAADSWRLEGIRLGDAAPAVAAEWGRPTEKTKDELQASCETWSYKDGKAVGLCDGAVTFVQVTAKAGAANVDGANVALTGSSLRAALGRPAFEADDGWGVLRGEEAIKVFEDEDGSVVSVDLFLGPCGA